MIDSTPKRRELMAVAAAALAWNRARLQRIAVAKLVPGGLFHPNRSRAEAMRAAALKAEAHALAGLRKACRIADPVSLTINVQAEFLDPELLTPEAPQ
ncbi:MAG: hypothetical protein EPN34_13945 [Burkholderiaceae bacterium]|nr:MAG: hypothetical protein EPN34_13945 [Burkholderiaceae bacterium]